MAINDYSDLIYLCSEELHRIGLTWRSLRIRNYCEKCTGFRDAHYLGKTHLEALLKKLQTELTPVDEIEF